MRQDEVLQDGNHERVRGPVVEEAIDPPRKAAMQGELGTEDFVLSEDQKQAPYCHPQTREGSRVSMVGIERFFHVEAL